MPENCIPKEAAYQIINDELMLDGNPRLNLASFVTTWMEPECDKLMMAAINKNYVDMDEYPVTTELQAPLSLSNLLLFLRHRHCEHINIYIGYGLWCILICRCSSKFSFLLIAMCSSFFNTFFSAPCYLQIFAGVLPVLF